MSVLASACDLAFDLAADLAGESIVYVRGEEEVHATAIVGAQRQQVWSDAEVLINRQRLSFALDPVDLTGGFDDETFEPLEGDRIKYAPPGQAIILTFALRPETGGEPVYRPTDRYHSRWRVTPVLVDVEAA